MFTFFYEFNFDIKYFRLIFIDNDVSIILKGKFLYHSISVIHPKSDEHSIRSFFWEIKLNTSVF